MLFVGFFRECWVLCGFMWVRLVFGCWIAFDCVGLCGIVWNVDMLKISVVDVENLLKIC
jgi:hypothetical protein